MDWNTLDISGDSKVMLSFFGCSKFSVRVCNISDIIQGKHLWWIDRKYNCHECWCYPYKMMFSAYKSVIVSPCACDLFVSKVTKITRTWMSVLAVIFWHFFSVWWLYLEINHSLVAEIICTIYSFTQHNISNKNSFQQCFIFKWSA